MFVGGGFRDSCGLWYSLDLVFPTSFIFLMSETGRKKQKRTKSIKSSSQQRRIDADLDLFLGPGVNSQALAK